MRDKEKLVMLVECVGFVMMFWVMLFVLCSL